MPTCQNCNTKWSWRQALKKSITLKSSMSCPFCSEKQYQTWGSKIINGLLVGGIVLFTSAIRVFTNIPIAVWVIFFLLIIIAYFLLYPFLLKLKSGDDVEGKIS